MTHIFEMQIYKHLHILVFRVGMKSRKLSRLAIIGSLTTELRFLERLASGDCCRLLITFANNLDTDQDRQNVLLIWIQTV